MQVGRSSVAGILLLPPGDEPAPGAVLLHGFSSRKEHIVESAGVHLARRGVASLALDLPLHGARDGDARSIRNPLEVVKLWRLALKEASAAAALLRAHEGVDGERIGVAGFSLGSFLALQLAAGDGRIGAVVVASGGDLPGGSPLEPIARLVADPVRAAGRLKGRPLLMLHGRFDRTVAPAQAERLFAGAKEPKELRWFQAGHRLPQEAAEVAALWLAGHL